jgi:hypothetical protein
MVQARPTRPREGADQDGSRRNRLDPRGRHRSPQTLRKAGGERGLIRPALRTTKSTLPRPLGGTGAPSPLARHAEPFASGIEPDAFQSYFSPGAAAAKPCSDRLYAFSAVEPDCRHLVESDRSPFYRCGAGNAGVAIGKVWRHLRHVINMAAFRPLRTASPSASRRKARAIRDLAGSPMGAAAMHIAVILRRQ